MPCYLIFRIRRLRQKLWLPWTPSISNLLTTRIPWILRYLECVSPFLALVPTLARTSYWGRLEFTDFCKISSLNALCKIILNSTSSSTRLPSRPMNSQYINRTTCSQKSKRRFQTTVMPLLNWTTTPFSTGLIPCGMFNAKKFIQPMILLKKAKK